MSILFIPVAAMKILNVKYFVNVFRVINKRILLLTLIVFLIGFYLRNSEYRYGIDVDGLYYQEMAKNIYEKNIFAQGCALSSGSECKVYLESVVLPGYPYFIVLLFHLFGVNDISPMIISGVLGSLTIILIFLLSYFFFNDEKAALYSCIIFSLSPIDIYISPTAAVRPTAIFFMCLTFMFYLFALKKRKLSLWVTTALTLSYTIYVRLEYYLLFIPLIAYVFSNKQVWDRRSIRDVLIAIGMFLVHQIIAFNWLIHRNFGMTGGGSDTFSLQYIGSLPKIVSYFFAPWFNIGYLFNPIISSVIIVAIFLFLIHDKEKLPLFSRNEQSGFYFNLILFLAFLIGVSLFYHGTADKETLRYLQPLAVPYSIMAGFIFQWGAKKLGKDKVYSMVILLLTMSVFFIKSQFKPQLFADKRKDEYFIAEYVQIGKLLPSQSVVFTWQPQVFNFDFMRYKNFSIIAYGHDKFVNHKDTFMEFLNQNKDKPWFSVLIGCDVNQFCELVKAANAKLIKDFYYFSIYEIKDKNRLIVEIKKQGL
jgi:hypothetical protein